MIRIVRKSGSLPPAILQILGVTETQKLITKVEAGEFDFEFLSSIYGHHDVKGSLIDLQNNKCCFCESKIGHISYGDVEHFRPKAGWVQNDEAINKPGYYWLAYDWANLLLSCQKCNQRFKKNYFSLQNPNQRAKSHQSDLSVEMPVIVHPVDENPEDFICFKDEIPVGIDKHGRGSKTIERLGLDRELLNEQRRERLMLIKDIYNLANDYPVTFPELKQKAIAKIEKYYHQSQSDRTEYASMLRSFFKDNPIHQ
jgi:uncharacterized protein (TIGR02646 family)